ncbi:MAG: sugar ABC transporter substrate-binding protein [Ruminococcus sp.]|nr:sugar ABC transporter substrate-binding protein [Ruminococcus sp.]
MKTRRIAALCMCAVMTASLAACGGSGDKGASEGGKDKGGKLSVMIWDNYQEPGLKEIIADFTEETGIEAELQVVQWNEYWTLLEAGAQGGEMPDVFWMHSNESQRYMSNEILLDLTDKALDSELVDMSKYPEEIKELYTYDGKVYGIPKDIDTISLWYNKTMFDEAGVDYPDETWTWDTVVENAKELTKEDGSQYGIAIRNDNNQEAYYNIVYDMGGEIISDDKKTSGYDDPNTIKAMQYIEKLIQDGSMPSMETMSENNPDILLKSGKSAMSFHGSWMVSTFKQEDYIKENCDCAVMPMDADSGRRVSIYNGLGWAAAANGDNTENAWKLIEYLGSEKAQQKQAELGITMSAWDGTTDTWAGCAPEFNLQAYLDMRDDMVVRPYSRNTVTWENRASEIFKDVYSGNMSMEDACKQAAEEMNETLSEE